MSGTRLIALPGERGLKGIATARLRYCAKHSCTSLAEVAGGHSG